MSGLPQPIGRQKEVLVLPAEGHHVVLGTAGSGKTTLAIYRALYLANSTTDHHGRTLLVTFNRCLVAYLESLAGSIPRAVDVRNYHRFARGYLYSVGKMSHNCICGPEQMKDFCSQAVAQATSAGATAAVLGRPTEVLVEECKWLAQHGITTSNDYVAAERVGRAGTRIVRTDRPIVFEVYERYREPSLRCRQGLRLARPVALSSRGTRHRCPRPAIQAHRDRRGAGPVSNGTQVACCRHPCRREPHLLR